MTAFTDWLSLQIQAPGALAALVQALSVLLFLLIALRVWRNDRVRRRAAERCEIEALAEIADHACDLVVAVSDALGDEVNAHEFAESFERRQLIDADMMLEAIPPQALPSLSLLRPLFELRWTVERSLELADWLVEAIRDAEREGWREAADETRSLAERAAFAADAFRRVARAGHA